MQLNDLHKASWKLKTDNYKMNTEITGEQYSDNIFVI